MALPSGTVTFLFTDIEDSTHLWDQHPDVMAQAIEAHDDSMRRSIEAHGGHLLKTTGDGVFAVFDRAAGAVAAAVQSLRELMAVSHEEVGALRVRMGLHTGEGIERAGDYFGTAVNRAARVAGAARGGQILCSAATRLVAHEAADGYEFADLGVLNLRGLAEPEHVYHVTADGLGAAEAPASADLEIPNNLPATVSDFIGRIADVVGVSQLVGNHRLVTITGPGGVGKTRLALEVGRRVGGSFSDGAWFVDLSTATTEKAAIGAVATTLGVAEEPARSLVESVAAFVANKRLLLIVDNCEQVLEAIRRGVDGWMQAAPRTQVLATSRELLGAHGEAIWPLAPLGRADGGDEAMQLFISRSQAINPRIDIAAHLDDITQLCTDLDGMPLAIELAAARVTALTPAQIRERISDQFRILSRRGNGERHGSLQAAIEWSYGLLDEAERRLFEVLSVFPGGFDLSASEDVAPAAEVGDWEAAELLTSLVDKSLISAEPGVSGNRYRYLETIRRFAQHRLEASGRRDAARRALARWAVGRFGAASSEVPVHDADDWATLVAERRNLEEALESMMAHGGGSDVVRLALSLESIWSWLAWQDGLTWIERILALPELGANDRAVMLCGAASLEWSSGRQRRARELLDKAERLSVAEGFPLPLQGSIFLSIIHAFNDQAELSMRYAQHAKESLAPDDDAAVVTTVQVALMWAAVAVGQTELAERIVRQHLDFARRSGNPSIHASGLVNASVVVRAEQPDVALDMCNRAIAIAESAGAQWWQASAHLHRSYALLLKGEPNASLESFARAARLTREAADLRAFASAIEGVATLVAREGRKREALKMLAGALQLRDELGDVAGLRAEVAHRARLLDRLRAELGDEFDPLWEDGSRLDLGRLAQLVDTTAHEVGTSR